MTKVTESIWSNGAYTVPMSEVSYIQNMLDAYSKAHKQIRIIFKHSRWDENDQCFQPSLCLTDSMSDSFLKEWCNYRSELEDVSYDPHSLDMAAENLKGFFNEIQNICKRNNQNKTTNKDMCMCKSKNTYQDQNGDYRCKSCGGY